MPIQLNDADTISFLNRDHIVAAGPSIKYVRNATPGIGPKSNMPAGQRFGTV